MRRRRWRRFDSETLDHRSKRRQQGKESLREGFAVRRRGHGGFPGWFGEQQAGVEAGERANFVARHLVGTGMSLSRIPKWNNHKERKEHKEKALAPKGLREELSTGNVHQILLPLCVLCVLCGQLRFSGLCLHSGRQLLFLPLGRDADSPVDPGRWRNVVQGQPGGIVRSGDGRGRALSPGDPPPIGGHRERTTAFSKS